MLWRNKLQCQLFSADPKGLPFQHTAILIAHFLWLVWDRFVKWRVHIGWNRYWCIPIYHIRISLGDNRAQVTFRFILSFAKFDYHPNVKKNHSSKILPYWMDIFLRISTMDLLLMSLKLQSDYWRPAQLCFYNYDGLWIATFIWIWCADI